MKARNKKVLIIEDENTLLLVLGEKFRREGFTVFEARDGQQGLAAALKHHPDVILLDIIMPSMDGLTMLKKLREDKWGNNVPVIVLSNLGDPEQINEASNGGAVKYLIKSNWGLEDVVSIVRETLKTKV